VGAFADRLASAAVGTPELAEAAAEADREASDALFDDLNAPIAMGVLFTFIRKANAELDRGVSGTGGDVANLAAARAVFARINGVLDIVPDRDADDDADEIEAMLVERRDARDRRDFSRADAIRKDLEGRGIEIKDGPAGTTWKRVR